MKAFGFITGVSLMLLCSCATQNSIYPSLPAETALNPEAVINGAGEGNRTLVSTYPVLFLCKPLFYEGNACIVRFRELH